MTFQARTINTKANLFFNCHFWKRGSNGRTENEVCHFLFLERNQVPYDEKASELK
jgi:hypothetical protein